MGHRYDGPSSVQFDGVGVTRQDQGFDYESYSFGPSSNIEVFDGGGNISRVRSAGSSRDAAREALMYRRDVIAASVIRAYYDLLRAKTLLRGRGKASNPRGETSNAPRRSSKWGPLRAPTCQGRVRHSNTRLSLIQAKNGVDLGNRISRAAKIQGDREIDVDTTMTIELLVDLDAVAEVQHAMPPL